jgi:hypothetical protein
LLSAKHEQESRAFRRVCNNVAKIRKISEPAMVFGKKIILCGFFYIFAAQKNDGRKKPTAIKTKL